MNNGRSDHSHGAGQAKAKILAIGGGKGGIGKTIVSASLAIVLADLGKRVILVDADLGGANLHTVMGLYMPPRSLYDFYKQRGGQLIDFAVDTPVPGVRLLCGAPGAPGMANIRYWEKLKTIRQISKLTADFVIVDLGAGMSFNEIDFFNSADIGLTIANPEPTSVQECYNFVKVALFRKLKRAFLDRPEVLQLLNRSSDPMHVNDKRLIADIAEEVRNNNVHDGVRFYRLLTHTRVALILNRVRSHLEHLDGLSLQVAVQDMLRIRMEYWGYVPYSPGIATAIKNMRPIDLLSGTAEARENLSKMVKKFLLGEDVRYVTPGARVIVPITEINRTGRAHPKVLEHDATRICSIHCRFWDHCEYQEGGLPCQMPEREYKKRLAAGEGEQAELAKNKEE